MNDYIFRELDKLDRKQAILRKSLCGIAKGTKLNGFGCFSMGVAGVIFALCLKETKDETDDLRRRLNELEIRENAHRSILTSLERRVEKLERAEGDD